MQATAQAAKTTATKRAITDVYDEQRRNFLVQYPVAAVVTLALAGVLAFGLVGFLGFRDEFEPGITRAVFHQPWPLFFWFCALIMTLQISILRHHTLRRQLTATLIVTTVSMILVGIAYYYNPQLQGLIDYLNKLLGKHLLLKLIGQSALTYTIINFLILGIFWFDTFRRWGRRARGLPPNPRIDIGLGDVQADDEDMPSMQELVAGDLIAGSVLAVLLSLVFRAEVISTLSDLLRVGVHIDTCTVSWVIGNCPKGGGGGLADPPTLSFIDLIQTLIYLPLGLLVLALSATLSGLAAVRGVDESALAENTSEQQALRAEVAAGDSNTESVSEQVSLTVLNTIRSALNRRRAQVAVGNFGYSLRNAVWPALILLGTIAVAASARGIQQYLHLLSDQRTCGTPDCPDYHVVQQLLAQGAQYQAVALALLWGLVAVFSIVFAAALLIYSTRVVENTLRFLGLIGFVLLLTFWLFSLALSAVNAFLSLTHASGRVPFPQPGVMTVISAVALVVYGVFSFVRRMRGAPVAATNAPRPPDARS